MNATQIMSLILGSIAIIAIIIIANFLIKKTKKKKETQQNNEQPVIVYKPIYINSSYVKKNSLLTYAEQEVFIKIKKAIENSKLIVFPQINLATIIEKINSPTHNELFRNLDFCLFEKNTFEPICAIELNDRTHERADRQERDAKVQAILASANISLITLYTTEINTIETIRNQIIKATNNFKAIKHSDM